MSTRTAATVSPAEVAGVYDAAQRSVTKTAYVLGISEATVRTRLRTYYGVSNVPKPPLRSSSAAIGAAFERRVRDALTSAGWWVVRAAGSKGEADLVALPRDRWVGERYHVNLRRPLLVNVKRGGSVPVAEWNVLHELAVATGAEAVVAFMPKRGGGIAWRAILDPKDGARGKRQPWVEWTP